MNKINKFRVAVLTEGGSTATGTFYATNSLAKGLTKLGLDVYLITSTKIPNVKVKQLVMKWPLINVPLIGRISWFISLYFRLRKFKFNVIHSFGYGIFNILPWNRYKKTLKVTTIGDVMCDNKEFTKGNFSLTILAKVLQPLHLKFNDEIITYTEDNKEKISKIKKVRKNKIHVVPLALDKTFKKIKDKKTLDSVRKKFDLPKKFIFNAGNLKANKNIINTIKAFKLATEKMPDLELVFSGKLDRKNPSLYQKDIINELKRTPKNVSSKIRFLGHVTYEELASIYTLSSVLIMVSLEEGFGVPLLEAMNCETPIVTSNISSMPWIAQNAGILVNPRKPEDISKAILNILENKSLRNKLIKNGVKRTKFFSQEKTACMTYDVYSNGYKKKFLKRK